VLKLYAVQKDLEERSEQLQGEESGIADQRVRFEAERATEIYDELGTNYVCTF
jgi:hypothetical protein